MKTILYLASVVMVVALTGCASPAKVENMATDGQPSQRVATTPLRNNLAVRDVTGGKETNPMWVSNVGSNEFEQALEASLKNVGLFAPKQAGDYFITAHLEKLDQPFIGISMTVTSSILYTVTERKTGKNIYTRSIVTPYTASFSDAALGVERLRLANEGSIRENIKQVIDDLFRLNMQNIAVK